MRALLAISLFFAIAPNASKALGSSFILNPAISYLSRTSTANGEETEQSTVGINAILGYRLPSGLLIGGKYLKNTTTEDAGEVKAEMSTSAIGAVIGWHAPQNVSISFTYLLSSEHELSTTSTAGKTSLVFTGSQGMMLDFGYRFGSGSVTFGPQITYISLTYGKVTTTNIAGSTTETLTKKWGDDWIWPYFGVWVTL